MTSDCERRLAAMEARVESEARLRASVDADLSKLEEQQNRMTVMLQQVQMTQTNHWGMLIDYGNKLTRLHDTQQEQGLQLKSLHETQQEQGLQLNSLHETQQEHGLQLNSLQGELNTLETKVDRVLQLLERPPV